MTGHWNHPIQSDLEDLEDKTTMVCAASNKSSVQIFLVYRVELQFGVFQEFQEYPSRSSRIRNAPIKG